MKTILVTVSDDRFGRKDGKYSTTQDKIEYIFKNNQEFGIHDFNMWKFDDIINSEFYNIYKHLLDKTDPSQNGRLYKPLIIKESLNNLNDGDFLIYNDCSPELWKLEESYKIESKYKLNIIKQLCIDNGGILTSHVKWNHNIHVKKGEVGCHTHENFTTEMCLNTMNLQEYKHSLQHASGMIVLQKSDKSTTFINDWVYWNSIEECSCLGSFWDDEINIHHKIGHRHDQSVSGLLINKMNNRLIETLDYYERPDYMNPYNFLNFCIDGFKYNFFDSNQPPTDMIHKIFNNGHIWDITSEKRSL